MRQREDKEPKVPHYEGLQPQQDLRKSGENQHRQPQGETAKAEPITGCPATRPARSVGTNVVRRLHEAEIKTAKAPASTLWRNWINEPAPRGPRRLATPGQKGLRPPTASRLGKPVEFGAVPQAPAPLERRS